MLKGTTRIELTNVKTGEVEVIEKNNLVTNAVADLLQLNPDGLLYQGDVKFALNFLPICPNAIGGILLYQDRLPEDPSKYYAPDTNEIVGYSSNDANNTVDERRGSMNLTESGPLDDGSGYRFVFDFATSQANGTVSALGLTSKSGGIAGYGSPVDGTAPVLPIGTYRTTYSYADLQAGKLRPFEHILSVDYDANVAFFAYVSAAGALKVGKIHVGSICLLTDLNLKENLILEQATVKTTKFASVVSSYSYTSLMDDGNGYIWGFGHSGNGQGNNSGNASIDWVKIRKTDWTLEEGTWSVPAQIRQLGMVNISSNYDSFTYCTIHNGRLYCVAYDQKAIVSISLDNPSDVVRIENPNGVIPLTTYGNNEKGGCEFNTVGNVLYYPGGYIIRNTAYPVYTKNIGSTNHSSDTSSPRGLRGATHSGLTVGPYMFTYNVYIQSSMYYVERRVWVMTPYLATINNLETPVTKTADKTMKITYILREE